MTLWVVLILLCFVALAFVVWPLYRSSGRLTPILAAVIVLTVGLSTALYHRIGQPGVPSGAGTSPDIGARVVALEKAVELEQGQNAQTLVALAIALMEREGGDMTDRAAGLFENALALEPNDANALFYGGGAAARRGNTALAADRWETLMGMNAPPEIRELLQRKINEWRGLPPPTTQAVQTNTIVSINVSISKAALQELPADATVYVIARDPAQPSPPIAVTPRRLSELPALVTLGDGDAMMPDRPLSGFSELEIIARVSISGSPMAQSGDWSGSLLIDTGDQQSVDLIIDQKVPW